MDGGNLYAGVVVVRVVEQLPILPAHRQNLAGGVPGQGGDLHICASSIELSGGVPCKRLGRYPEQDYSAKHVHGAEFTDVVSCQLGALHRFLSSLI